MNNSDAVFGIIGTLLGTILGWLLNQLSSKGKLRIYTSSWEDRMTHHDNYGSVSEIKSADQLQFYSYKSSLDIYNSSSEPRIMRDVHVIFTNKKVTLLSGVPFDAESLHGDSRLPFYNEITPITVSAKSAVRIKIRNSEQSGEGRESFIWNTKRIYLTYRNEKNRLKRVLIHEEDYSKRLDNFTKEEQECGKTENAQPK